ncbi:Uncharacterised protein [uncultured Blautia sp.]|nr:Uncharacterised protein [uncultured Blautia sp.]
MGRLIPSPTCLLRFLHQIFILQEGCPFHPLLLQVLVQVWADSALSRINLQPSQNSQYLCLLLKTLAFLGIGIFIVGDDAAIQGGVADLSHP